MKRALPMVLKYLAIVVVSCLLAFFASHRIASAQEMTAPGVSASMKSNDRIAYADVGAYGIETSLNSWADAARKREVPVKIYFPVVAPAETQAQALKFPVILFSHGLGG
ncbi:MAG: hypothetical protein LH481_16610, partial [Burkholderiales bacterium]|nr:hypothetical protein [Burkholderiales bacterium]